MSFVHQNLNVINVKLVLFWIKISNAFRVLKQFQIVDFVIMDLVVEFVKKILFFKKETQMFVKLVKWLTINVQLAMKEIVMDANKDISWKMESVIVVKIIWKIVWIAKMKKFAKSVTKIMFSMKENV